jgi:hypothetical protein
LFHPWTDNLSLHASGAYFDLKIVCGPDTYNVHKNIICPQSEFLHAACRPDALQEGKTGVITLPFNPGRNMDALKVGEFDWDLDVEDTSTVKHMIHYFYHHDCPSKLPTHMGHNKLAEENVTKGVLAIHFKMYAIRDKYQIPGLKALAVQRFKTCWKTTSGGFATAIVIAFMSTSEVDQELRQAIVDMFDQRIWMAGDTALDDTIKQIPELVYALFRKLLKKRNTL